MRNRVDIVECLLSEPRAAILVTLTQLRNSSDRLFRAFRAREHPDPVDLEVCLAGIAHVVRARYPGLSRRDLEEIASDAITGLFEAARAEREIGEPASWMLGFARNASYDQWKALQRTTPSEDPLSEVSLPNEAEDGILRLIDALTDKLAVKQAIRAALADEDRTVIRTIVAWLDLYETTGTVPSVRTVGARADVSPSTVAKALVRFARYLRDASGGQT
jgi:hypothetical protein